MPGAGCIGGMSVPSATFFGVDPGVIRSTVGAWVVEELGQLRDGTNAVARAAPGRSQAGGEARRGDQHDARHSGEHPPICS
jgi:hypothetical protein